MIYGLGVHSDLPLWGVPVERCPRDLTIHRRNNPTPGTMANGGGPGEEAGDLRARNVGDEIRLHWPRIARIRIRQGREIVVEEGPLAQENHLRHVAGGLCMGLALHQRGLLTLHASAVAIEGGAVAFVGGKVSGKSTLAATLARRGHSVLTDDVVVLELSAGERPRVMPGLPVLTLWPDAAIRLGEDPASLPRIWSEGGKLIRCLERPSDRTPVPLRCLFVLASREEGDVVGEERVTIEPLSSTEAFTSLVGHSHALRLVDDPESLPRHARQCGQVVNSVPVFRLARARSPDVLPSLARSVEKWVETSA